MRDANAEKELQCLLEKIYRERGFDFREYKETTVTRRLRRRLRARAVLTYSDYGRWIRTPVSTASSSTT